MTNTSGLGKHSDLLNPAWQVFLTVYECRSFSKAAEILGVSQPALTRHIQKLEDEIGIDLFDRQSRPIKPSAEAKVLREELVKSVYGMDKVLSDLKYKNYIKPVMRMGCVESLSSHLVPALVKHFLPKVSFFSQRMGSSDVLIGQLLRKELDIVIICDSYNEIPSLSRLELFEEPSILLMPKDFEGMKPPQSWSELLYCGLPLLSPPSNTGAGRLNLRFLASEHLDLLSVCEVDSDAVMAQLVADGIGWSITRPSTLLADTSVVNQLVVFPTPEPRFSRKIWCISREKELVQETMQVKEICQTVFRQQILPRLKEIAPWPNE